jgi:hypothetical protein
MRYVHRWHTPVVVKVNGVDEHWYNAPCYDPKRVPATLYHTAFAHYYDCNHWWNYVWYMEHMGR